MTTTPAFKVLFIGVLIVASLWVLSPFLSFINPQLSNPTMDRRAFE
jgi:hypothetical protein